MSSDQKIQLKEKRIRIEESLRKISSEIKTARREHASTGRGIPIKDLANMEAKEAFLKSESQKVQHELGRIASLEKQQRNDLFCERFIDAAKQILDRETYLKILDRVQFEAKSEETK
jgi:hypothetical protein